MADILTDYITVGSCALHLLVAGKQGARDIVLLHGLKFQAATWQELGTLNVLAANGCHAIALDMPGFGKSPTCDEEPAAVLGGVIDRKTAGKSVILGPSMGGRIALEFVIAHPQQVSALVLVGAVGVEENRKRLAEIKVPTLLIWGGEDQISPLDNSDILLAEIAGSARRVIKGASHPCYLDKPETFHAAVLDFLDSLS